tara:strand:- start:119 stop:709 length:591 start_codon:yes stop_codon:yes gene_type:complete
MLRFYVYRIDRPSKSEWYIGIRQCKCAPSKDTGYMGSGRLLKAKMGGTPADQWVKTILVQVETREESARIEAALVGPEQLRDPKCLNRSLGGDVGFTGAKQTEEAKQKISRGNKGKRLGMKSSPETRAKQSASKKGKRGPLSDEHKAILSAARMGKKTGPMSEEQKEKISKAWTPERKAAQAEIMRKVGKNNRTPK